MELTLAQISYLLEVAAKSPFTAEQIAGLIRERQNQEEGLNSVPCLPTMWEVFSRTNIKRFTEDKSLASRIFHIMDQFSFRIGEMRIDEFIVHPNVGPIHRWKNCGVKSQRVIRLMFAHYGCEIR